MSFMLRRREAQAGFSLIEALVALAIAAFLAAMLTRFMSGTRATAYLVREEVAMDVLSDGLLERVVARDLQPGRTDGRTGSLRWHIDIAPIAFYAQARSIAEKKPRTAQTGLPGQAGQTSPLGQAAVPGQAGFGGPAGQLGQTPGLSSSDKEGQTAAQARPAARWNAYHVTAFINSPSGRSRSIDTLRIAQQQAEPQSAQPDRR